MFDSELVFCIRTIVFAHVLILTMTPELTLRLQHELVKLWKTLKAPILLKQARQQKKSSFWEVDMTKFEP